MAQNRGESREDRKARFIASLKSRQSRELLEPLLQKIQSFLDGSIPPDDVFKAVHYVAVQSEKIAKRYRNRPDVVLAEIAMDENKFTTEIGEIGIKARLGDITSVFVDAIVNPADPGGVMSAGVAGAIKAAGGEEIEKEAVSKAPIALGEAIATTAGKLANLYVIHVAAAEGVNAPCSADAARRATAAALALAEELEVESVAIPAVGTGAGGVPPEDAAAAIVEAVKAHRAKSLTDVTLIAKDEGTVDAFVKVLERYDEENG